MDAKAFMRRFFISHRGLDTTLALHLESLLQKLGQETVLDVLDFVPGQSFTHRMVEAEKDSDHTVVVMTEHFLESSWCRQELEAALATDPTRKQAKLLLVMAGQMKDEDLPVELQTTLYIDLRNCDQLEQDQRFTNAVKAVLKGTRRPIPELEHNILVLFACFRQLEGTHRQPGELWPYRLRNDLVDLIKSQDMGFIELSQVVDSEDQAKKLLKSSGATVLIWGTIADSMIEVRYTNSLEWRYLDPPDHSYISTDIDPQRFKLFVDQGGDSEYLLNIILASISCRSGNYERALELYSRALNCVSTDRVYDLGTEAVLLNRCAAYIELRRFELALEDANKTIELYPYSPRGYLNRGVVYFKKGESNLALADLNKAIHLDSTLALAYYNRANVWMALSKLDQAFADYTKTIELDPSYFRAYNNRALIYRRRERRYSALEDLNKAIDLCEEYAPLYFNRGILYALLGVNTKALKDLNVFEMLVSDYDSRILVLMKKVRSMIS